MPNADDVRTVMPLGYNGVAEVDHAACEQPTGDQGGCMFRGNRTSLSTTLYNMHLNTILQTVPTSPRSVCTGSCGKRVRSSREEPPGSTGQWRDIIGIYSFCTSVSDMSTNLWRKTAGGQKKVSVSCDMKQKERAQIGPGPRGVANL